VDCRDVVATLDRHHGNPGMHPDPSLRDSIIRRASKLLAFQAGTATTAEVELAAQRLGELLQAHNLTMQDIRVETLRQGIREERTRSGFARRPRWVIHLAAGVASACACTLITSYDIDEETSDVVLTEIFVGHEADAAVARYFYDVLIRLLPEMARAHVRTYPARLRTRARNSYLLGVSDTVWKRLHAMLQPIGADQVPSADPRGPSTGLIHSKKLAIQLYLDEHRPDVHMARKAKLNRSQIDLAALQAGCAAGNTVALHHGVRGGGPVAGITMRPGSGVEA
jgi:hypothetical protein